MKAENRYKATATLAAAAAGFFVSYPYQHTFWGALLSSGFSAAMVGGLADWYAVTALFRKPLQIPYHTAIIPKNRERLFNAIIVMVEEELLTADNIRETLSKAGLAHLIMQYAAQAESRRQLYMIAGRLVQKTVDTIDAAQLAAAFDLLLTEHKDKVRFAPLAGQALEWSLRSGFAEELIDLGISEIKLLIKEKYMTGIIASMYRGALNAYAAKQTQHKLVGWILEKLLNLDPVTIAGLIQEKLAGMLEGLHNRDHHLRQQLTGQMVKLAEDLQTDDFAGQTVEAVLKPQAIKLIERLASLPADHPAMVGGWSKWTLNQAAKLVADLTADADRQARLDALLIDWLCKWVHHNHSEIGRLVGSYLNSFSNEELVEYIESKVMNDLQMIRINGSIVGGLVGIALFLITYAIGVGP
ncbi:MAG: hypothetical protein K0R55_25 [Sporomusa sp.]|jgi:uncharacterized membrane-anchored protein YjiN (DUF445 family)|nr:hypothetical protein [Sporomusa sp.]